MGVSPQEYLSHVKKVFETNGKPETAEGQRRYMRYQFDFYGLKATEWVPLAQEIFKEYGYFEDDKLKEFVQLCFADDYREIQFFGIEMVQRVQKNLPSGFISVFEEMIVTKSWWDTVDWIAKLVGIHFLKYPALKNTVTERWMESKNIWLQRVCLIFQLLYKEKTDSELMFRYIRRLKDSKEFFIQKGAAWALRQYSKVNPPEVIHFIEHTNLAPLTKREGSKWLKKQGKI